ADGHLVVADGFFGLKAVIRVDPHTGDRTVISSDATTGQGPSFGDLHAIAVEADGHLVVAGSGFTGNGNWVVRVDPHTGNRTVISGQGPDFGFPTGVAVEADGHLVVTDSFYFDAGLRA